MVRTLLYLTVIVTSLAIMFIQKPGSTAFNLTSAFFVGFAVPFVDILAANWDKLTLVYYSVVKWNTDIRLSISCLFRIERNGKYLLIRGRRYDQFQPIGGVVKAFPSGNSFLREIEATADDLIPRDSDSLDDLRIYVKGKHLYEFMNWFSKSHGREVDAWREFYEEMVKSNIVPSSRFPYIRYQFIKRHVTKLNYSTHARSYEILIADIYELLPTEDQDKVLAALDASGANQTLWATRDEILRHGALPGRPGNIRIGSHTEWIL